MTFSFQFLKKHIRSHFWKKRKLKPQLTKTWCSILPSKTWSRHTGWLMTTSLYLLLHLQCLVHHAPTHPASESTGMSHGTPASNTISKWQKLRKCLPPCWWIEHVRWIPRLKEPQVFVDADHVGPLEHDLLAPDRVRNTCCDPALLLDSAKSLHPNTDKCGTEPMATDFFPLPPTQWTHGSLASDKS